MNKKERIDMRKSLIFIGLGMFFFTACESAIMGVKNMQADFGKVPREVILMNYNGDTLEKYNTNYIESDYGASIYFEDENHKRIVLSGGIIVCKEK